MKKPEAIIRSMTPKERRRPEILNASRRRRIAAGSGTTVQDVNQLHPPIRRDEEADEDGYEPVARQEGAFPLPADALNPRKPTII